MSQTVVLIAARARNGTIGRDGALPWRLPADLRRFKTLTMGKAMVMGRKTFESFPAPLPGRRHIVLTRDAGWAAEGAEVAHDLDEALALAGEGDVVVIGGAQIYALFADRADQFELTQVHADVEGDTKMPPPGSDWHEVAREEHPADGERPAFAFVTLQKLPARLREGLGVGSAIAQPLASPPPPPPAGGRGRMRLDARNRVPDQLRGAVIALGNFDGFHLGHQAVVGEAVRWAKAEGRPAIVATFDPHPVRHFKPDAAPFRLTTIDQREELFAAAGADAMLVFRFDGDLAATTADEFVNGLLIDRIGAAGVVTGEDFTFGKSRGGNVAVLRDLGALRGLGARTVGPVFEQGEVVSSSRIRAAIQAGDCETAARLMTRPFAIRGIVQHGDKLGRTIGFPTANLPLIGYLRPRYGIYAVTGHLPGGVVVQGAANVGIRPTFDPPKELLEPYFFDWSGDLYGAEIEVAFHHFLRPEAKFAQLDDLTAQMARDCDAARQLLGGGKRA